MSNWNELKYTISKDEMKKGIDKFIFLQGQYDFVEARTYGHIAEDVLRDRLGLAPIQLKKDGGVDLKLVMRDGALGIATPDYEPEEDDEMIVGTVDVKSTLGSLNYPYHQWVVNAYKPLESEYYLFLAIDKINGEMGVVGWMLRDEVMKKGTFVKKDNWFRHNKVKANNDLYNIEESMIHPAKSIYEFIHQVKEVVDYE